MCHKAMATATKEQMSTSGTSSTKRGRRRRSRGPRNPHLGNPVVADCARIERPLEANIAPAISTAISIARADIEECVMLLRHADDLAVKGKTKLALDRVLDVEPRLFETQHLLNAATRMYRTLKGAAPPL